MPCIGLGAKVEFSAADPALGSPGTYTVVDDIVNLTVPDEEFGVVESKRLNLAIDKTIRKLITMKDAGEISFQYEFGAAKFLAMNGIKGANRAWRITLPSDGTDADIVFVIPGTLRGNKVEPVVADEIEMVTATIVATGPATIT